MREMVLLLRCWLSVSGTLMPCETTSVPPFTAAPAAGALVAADAAVGATVGAAGAVVADAGALVAPAGAAVLAAGALVAAGAGVLAPHALSSQTRLSTRNGI